MRSAPTWSGELRALGLEIQVQDTVGAEAGQLSGAAAGATLAQVRNVVARLPGTDSHRPGLPGGALRLGAGRPRRQRRRGGHRGAAGGGPRADRRPGPATTSSSSSPTPRRRASAVPQAFAAEHPLAAEGGVVLNLEARGSTGPVIMFETSRRNAALVGRLRRSRGAPARHLVRGGGLPVAAQRHRLHRVPRRRLRRAELRLHRRRGDLPHAPGHAGSRWTAAASSTTARTRWGWPGSSAAPTWPG